MNNGLQGGILKDPFPLWGKRCTALFEVIPTDIICESTLSYLFYALFQNDKFCYFYPLAVLVHLSHNEEQNNEEKAEADHCGGVI